jgi:hypothetical protein
MIYSLQHCGEGSIRPPSSPVLVATIVLHPASGRLVGCHSPLWD